jgi:alkylation response protein AidB-like acyl-CoA dehydrogenase
VQQTLDSIQEIRTLAADFARERLRPHVERWDHDGALDDDTLPSVAESGFAGMLVPERYGGLDLGLPAFGAATEALGWGEPAVAFAAVANTAVAATLLAASPDPQPQVIEGVAAGAPVAWPLAGDTVRAVRDGDGWRVDGELGWVLSTGEQATVIVPATGDAGAMLFWLSIETPGVTWTRESTLGLRPARIGRLRFENAIVPDDACIARESAAVTALGRGREIATFGAAAIAAGIARAALEHATAYAAEREQFRRRLREFEGIQVKLADIAVRAAAAHALLVGAATSGQSDAIAMAKLFASEAATFAAREAVQIFGGYGYMRDYPVEKLMRDAKATEVLCTRNEDLRVDIAAGLYDS